MDFEKSFLIAFLDKIKYITIKCQMNLYGSFDCTSVGQEPGTFDYKYR